MTRGDLERLLTTPAAAGALLAPRFVYVDAEGRLGGGDEYRARPGGRVLDGEPELRTRGSLTIARGLCAAGDRRFRYTAVAVGDAFLSLQETAVAGHELWEDA